MLINKLLANILISKKIIQCTRGNCLAKKKVLLPSLDEKKFRNIHLKNMHDFKDI